MKDGQAGEALHRLRRNHGVAVVAEDRPGNPAFGKGLAKAVHETLDGLAQVPLGVATDPAVVVQDAEQPGRVPPAARQQDGARGGVKVEMPEAVRILHLEGPHLARINARLGPLSPRAADRTLALAAHQPVGLHVAQDRAV